MAYNKVNYVDGVTPLNANTLNRNENATEQLANDVQTLSNVIVQVDGKVDSHNHDSKYATKDSEHSHSNKSVIDNITSAKVTEWNNKSNFSGNYNDLTNKPTIDVTKSYVDTELAKKSNVGHSHTKSDITDFMHRHNASDIDGLSPGSNITVENSLTSTSTTNALAAAQGKVLDDKLTVLSTSLDEVNQQYQQITNEIGNTHLDKDITTLISELLSRVQVLESGITPIPPEPDLPIIPNEDLPIDFPKIKVSGESVSDMDFLITPHSTDQKLGYIFIANSKGQIKWYLKLPKFAYLFRKYKTKSNKIRYTYLQTTSRPSFTLNGGFDNCELVVLNEKFEEIKRTRLLECGRVPSNYEAENHDYIFIDDEHYIIACYLATTTNDIEGVNKEVRIVDCIIQEVKNNQVVWQFDGMDCKEFYNASCFNNNYSDFGLEQDTYNDYSHLNSFVIDERDGNLLTSWRHIGLVKIERYTNKILWIMGRGRNDITGSTTEQCGYLQHDARYEDDYSITIFDNSGCETDNTRVCRYWIDEENKSLTKFEEFKTSKPRSGYMGSAELINIPSNDNIYNIVYGGGMPSWNFEEYNFTTKTQNMNIEFVDGHDMYRISRGEFKGNSNFTTPSTINVLGISFIHGDVNLSKGATYQSKYVLNPIHSTNKNVTFTSQDTTKVTVNADGIITAKEVGNSLITITSQDGSKTDTFTVNVIDSDFTTRGLIGSYESGTEHINPNIWGDLSGNNNDLTLNNFTHDGITNGWIDGKLKIREIDKITIDPIKGDMSQEFSFEFYMKFNSNTDIENVLIGFEPQNFNGENNVTPFKLGANPSTTRMAFIENYINNDNAKGYYFKNYNTVPLTVNDFNHIVCTSNSQGINLYINGVLITSASVGSIVNFKSFLPLNEISCNIFEYKFQGEVEVFRIYNRVLTQEEVMTNLVYCTRNKVYPVTGVSLNKTSVYLNPSATVQLIPTIEPLLATNKKIIWSSSNANAVVDNNGLVTGVNIGECTITATTEDGGFTSSCNVVVTNEKIPYDLKYYSQGSVELISPMTYKIKDTNTYDQIRLLYDKDILSVGSSYNLCFEIVDRNLTTSTLTSTSKWEVTHLTTFNNIDLKTSALNSIQKTKVTIYENSVSNLEANIGGVQFANSNTSDTITVKLWLEDI